MRLYMRPIAPNALKVMIFMAERGIAIETVDVGTLSEADYERVSPLKTVPSLETDDGLFVTESLTICQYLDEISDGPSLFGDRLNERTLVSMWERRAEQLLMQPAIEYGHHCQPMFTGALRQFPDWAKEHVQQCHKMLALMEARLAESRFLAADRFTMADVTAFLGVAGLIGWGAIELKPGPALGRWMGDVGARPSMAPLRALAQQFGLKSI
ncbi:glutathione S-transferase family protein [Sphingomonas tabacisoli]|uniref:Glutathione S-transferase family protein n=1 Tax=Sphingomonas tabacisoli TaxID=2249466 RepID=A0ABW4I3G9_9SPHN